MFRQLQNTLAGKPPPLILLETFSPALCLTLEMLKIIMVPLRLFADSSFTLHQNAGGRQVVAECISVGVSLGNFSATRSEQCCGKTLRREKKTHTRTHTHTKQWMTHGVRAFSVVESGCSQNLHDFNHIPFILQHHADASVF